MKQADSDIIQLLREIKALAGGGAAAVWGAITGTLGNQTDLSNALALKQTAAQVQALIDAKGVIGRAVFDPSGGLIAGPNIRGIITGVSWAAVGKYTIAVNGAELIPGSDAIHITAFKKNVPLVAGGDDTAVTATGFEVNIYDPLGMLTDASTMVMVTIER